MICGLGSLAWHQLCIIFIDNSLSFLNYPSVTLTRMSRNLWLGVLGFERTVFGYLAWDLGLTIFGLASLAWGLRLGIFGLGSVIVNLQLVSCGL